MNLQGHKTMMNKMIAGLLVAAALLAASFDASASTLSLVPSSNPVTVGQPLKLDVRIDGLAASDDLAAMDLMIDFDPLKLAFSSLSLGDGLGQLGVEAFDLGSGLVGNSVRLFELSFLDNLSFQNSSFVLATLSFDTLHSGTSSLGFSNVMLSDAWGNALVADTNGVTVGAVPEPASLLLVVGGLAALGLRRRSSR
ncbi:PEP-CTERM sorting domain-containing protein [Pelomonas sp. SE-A7]|uniref:PEP-CTERM sorting domain-containing protein n=1 Tax=Pelomonas sp. SE-A7 TaxID=3054953 RepID=UPI00259D0346|nr:PEP-CTERM sorting domain-containing protein [Pelomonas sp. SE-A7]MDM4765085.1 PEP-CTERM sorting domain-containing protein [Pelomonas sp. SE-A7]